MVQEYPLFEGQGVSHLASILLLVGILPFLCWDHNVKYSLMLLQRWQNLCLPTDMILRTLLEDPEQYMIAARRYHVLAGLKLLYIIRY